MSLSFLAYDESSAVVDCHNGVWNATMNTCDCASGWTTDWTNQDILGGGIVYCSSRASTPAPGNTTAATATGPTATLSTAWIIVIVVAAAAAVVVIGIICFCCCRCRRRRDRESVEEEHRHQQRREAQAQAEADQQRYSQELQQRLWEDELLWNQEARLQRQKWDTQQRWQPCSESTLRELYDGSYSSLAGVTVDHRFSYPQFTSSRSLPPPVMEMDPRVTASAVDPRHATPHPTPRAHHDGILHRQPSSNLYDTDSTATTDECIFTEYSDSPPPRLLPVYAVSGTTPFTTPRHAEPYDPSNPF